MFVYFPLGISGNKLRDSNLNNILVNRYFVQFDNSIIYFTWYKKNKTRHTQCCFKNKQAKDINGIIY